MCPPTASPTTDSTTFFKEQLSFRGLTLDSVKSKKDEIVEVLANDIFGVHVNDIKIVSIQIAQTGNRRRRRRLQTSGSKIVVVYSVKANSDSQKGAIKAKVSNAKVFAAKAAKPAPVPTSSPYLNVFLDIKLDKMLRLSPAEKVLLEE